MITRLRLWLRDLRGRLWARPLAACVLSLAAMALAAYAEMLPAPEVLPAPSQESIESLLSIMASSMLVIAIFAAGAMVSAYASASQTATPRSFPLVLADDVSQNAYSMFLAAFIFGVIGLVALKNGSFGELGLVVLFVETITVFVLVVLTFVRWVDRIARLGRLANTVDRVEDATEDAIRKRRRNPCLGARPAGPGDHAGTPLYSERIGYVQGVDIARLQQCAEKHEARLRLCALPGTFLSPDRPLLRAELPDRADVDALSRGIEAAFRIGRYRDFDDDPRFGLVVLSEIAGRALSPAVNDPGTAIDITGRLVRLFDLWVRTAPTDDAVEYERVEVPALEPADLVDDAFTAISRDGAATFEVTCRLFKALATVARLGDAALAEAAKTQARHALAQAEAQLPLPEQRAQVRALAAFALDAGGDAR